MNQKLVNRAFRPDLCTISLSITIRPLAVSSSFSFILIGVVLGERAVQVLGRTVKFRVLDLSGKAKFKNELITT